MNETAYYGCKEEGGVLEKTADMNIYELKCMGHQEQYLICLQYLA